MTHRSEVWLGLPRFGRHLRPAPTAEHPHPAAVSQTAAPALPVCNVSLKDYMVRDTSRWGRKGFCCRSPTAAPVGGRQSQNARAGPPPGAPPHGPSSGWRAQYWRRPDLYLVSLCVTAGFPSEPGNPLFFFAVKWGGGVFGRQGWSGKP